MCVGACVNAWFYQMLMSGVTVGRKRFATFKVAAEMKLKSLILAQIERWRHA